MRCTVCSSSQVQEVNLLLGSGSSARRVARVFGLGRGAVTRHARHVPRTSGKFAVLEGQGGADVPPDPLAEAIALAQDAKTPRQKLRGLEAVRGATKLKLRGMDRADEADLVLLSDNVTAAERAYKSSPDFETRVRALQGLREAIMQRLDATPVGAIETSLVVTFAHGKPFGEPVTVPMSPGHYWKGVPSRLRDPSRYAVHRRILLAFGLGQPGEDITVREVATNAVAWTHRTEIKRPRFARGEGEDR